MDSHPLCLWWVHLHDSTAQNVQNPVQRQVVIKDVLHRQSGHLCVHMEGTVMHPHGNGIFLKKLSLFFVVYMISVLDEL